MQRHLFSSVQFMNLILHRAFGHNVPLRGQHLRFTVESVVLFVGAFAEDGGGAVVQDGGGLDGGEAACGDAACAGRLSHGAGVRF